MENKWIIDGHHYTCPACKKTIAIVVNESDEDFDFCPFCGKKMSGQMAENNRGREVYRAIDRILPQGDYQEWLEFWGMTQKELDTFMEAGEEAVNKMYEERDSDGRK